MQNFMGTRAAMKRFESLEEIETRRLLLRILRTPDALLDHLRTFVFIFNPDLGFRLLTSRHQSSRFYHLENGLWVQR